MVGSSPPSFLIPRAQGQPSYSTNFEKEECPIRASRIQKFGDELFWKIASLAPKLEAWSTTDLCGKITGMILDLDEKEIAFLIQDKNRPALQEKIQEAITLLEDYQFDMKMIIYKAVVANTQPSHCGAAAVVEWILGSIGLDHIGPVVKSQQCLLYMISRALASGDLFLHSPKTVTSE